MIHTPKTQAPYKKQTSILSKIRVGVISTILIFTGIITACSDEANTAGNSANNKEVIKIGTSPGDFGDLVRDYLGPELEKAGYKVTLSEITDIVIPNVSVEEGSLDLNIFQHKPYLDEFNRNQKGHLIPLVQVPTAPYGIYSGKLKHLSEVKNGATIGIPSNVTNFSRGLLILENIGWITLRSDIEDRFQIGKHDIIDNPYNLELKEIEAAQVVRVRPDLDYAIINGNFALDAGIHFREALSTEPSKDFINWVVIHEKNSDTPWAKKVIEILESDDFKTYSATRFANYNLPLAW
ncbi:MetQ/NlpA family ABC transporter substrate-binding protein [Ignatzschineria rhizosphaerae]|uniref:MetQ/NlpA family ABC transporter substrate-binding protein n=1 Tax=Ignatzschineria rhizosphaerae TaxID=2923279 RepID=A0ABY3WYM5_9GAMM|nr:MetQ/NlpA family ABC transporter substrate-binding protein [Ignatzschineria rhizosphaerae]UNM95723.1 MetQ/NlpA family ABC transporter substrate-binding protein [Ignatzschineria rhizosphaerae]